MVSSPSPHPHLRKHLCWPMGYIGMGVWSATPEPKQYFLALCSSNTPILGIQNQFCWPMGYSGIGSWSATPEHKLFFCCYCAAQTTPILGIQKHL